MEGTDGFARLAGWLQEHIHTHGAVLTLNDQLESFETELTAQPLLDYLSEKYS